MKVLVGAFNQKKALEGAFSVIVKLHTSRRFVSSSSSIGYDAMQPRWGEEIVAHSAMLTYRQAGRGGAEAEQMNGHNYLLLHKLWPRPCLGVTAPGHTI